MITLALDAGAVLVFAVVGRGSHGEDVLAGLAGTVWPFLLGLLMGHLAGFVALRPAFDPRRVFPGGVLIWACTVAVGMLARWIAGQGTAPTFILVAAAALAVLMLGWRLGVAAVAR